MSFFKMKAFITAGSKTLEITDANLDELYRLVESSPAEEFRVVPSYRLVPGRLGASLPGLVYLSEDFRDVRLFKQVTLGRFTEESIAQGKPGSDRQTFSAA